LESGGCAPGALWRVTGVDPKRAGGTARGVLEDRPNSAGMVALAIESHTQKLRERFHWAKDRAAKRYEPMLSGFRRLLAAFSCEFG